MLSDRGPTTVNFNVDYRNFVEGQFLARMLEGQLLTVRGASWITSSSLDALSVEVIASASYFHLGQQESLVQMDGAVAHLALHELSLTVRIAALDADACATALEQIKTAMPEDARTEQEVPIRLWWLARHGAQEMARRMPAPDWREISMNYSAPTHSSLDRLMGWEQVPDPGGRLVLWHGAPGTGKTTAIRALARRWQSWAEFQFITDPEHFLGNPGYLLETISNGSRSVDDQSFRSRWRVLVLEDAGEYLALDGKQLAGQGLSRLLNVCDGVLGQATRSLVLVTTNESLSSLNPALSRPGRCLADTEFELLDQSEIELWCDQRELESPEVSKTSLADLFAHADGRQALRSARELWLRGYSRLSIASDRCVNRR